MFESNKVQVKRRFITVLIAYWPGLLLLILLSIGGSWYYIKSFSPLYRAEIKVSTGDQDNQKIADQIIIKFRLDKLIAEDILSRLYVSAPRELPGIVELSIEDEVPQRAENILKRLVKIYNASYPEMQITNRRSDLKLIDKRIAKVEKDLLETERILHQNKNQIITNYAAVIQHQKDENAFYVDLLQKKEAAALALTLPALTRPDIRIVNVTVFSVITPPNPRMAYLWAISVAIIIGLAVITIMAMTGWETRSSLISETNYVNPANTPLEAYQQKITIAERLNKLKQSVKKTFSWDNLIHKNLEPSVRPASAVATGDIANNRVIRYKLKDFFLARFTKLKSTMAAWTHKTTEEKVLPYKFENEPEITENQRVGILEPLSKLKSIKKNRGDIEPDHVYEFLKAAPEITSVELLPVTLQAEKSIDNKQNISIAEQFSRLRQTLGELGINGDRKKVLITSAIPGEGKDFVAINLALSLALTGKKVVLLDFDFHRSSLGNELGVKQKTGISDYLKGNAGFDDIILATEIDKNLFFIPAGEVTDHEYELEINDLVTSMLNQLGSRFDQVIVSTAPVHPFADAYALSALCDATLYIVRYAFSRKIFTEEFNKFNILNLLKNVTVIFNEA